MTSLADRSTSTAIRESAHPLTGGAEEFAPLMDRIGDARFVLIGEASHGTHEFYRIRATITKELIRSKGTRAVEPLERTAKWVSDELPETYPSSL